MKRIRIALYDKKGYVASLVDYLCRKGRNLLETMLFTSREMLEKRALNKEIDILLAGEEVLEEVRHWNNLIPQIILLSEGDRVREGMEYPVIFKYQSAQEILKEVLSCAAENDKIPFVQGMVGGRQLEVISSYAPYGGAGTTEAALEAARESAVEKRTLFVSLELFQGLETQNGEGKGRKRADDFGRGMSEVSFYLKQRKEKLALKLETVITEWEQLDCIRAVEDYRDLQVLDICDLQYFLEVLQCQTDYDCVVFDIGYLSEATLWLMEQSSRVCMPLPHTDCQRLKRQSFQRFLLREEREGLIEKFSL